MGAFLMPVFYHRIIIKIIYNSEKQRGIKMSSWTLPEAKEYLQIWVSASVAVASGQSYKIGRRELTRASLSEIKKMIDFWRSEIARLESGRPAGMKTLRVIPVDR